MINLILTFTYKVSLKDWNKIGILNREISIYKKLSQAGINITFLTHGDKTDLNYSSLLENIKIIPIKKGYDSEIVFFIKSFVYPFVNRNLFKKAHIIKTNQMEGSWLTWPSKLFDRKILIIRCGYEVYKNTLYQYKLFKGKRILFRLIYLFIISLISYKLSDHILVSNFFDKEFIIKNFRIDSKKITILPNFIDTNIFKPKGSSRDLNRILFIGRLTKVKNLENLIKSFKKLENISLDIVGDGPLKSYLKKLVKKLNIQSKVNFLGTYPNEVIPDILNRYKLFVLPSFWEGNPKTLLEAMSCGITCIGTKIPGIMQIIKHKENGYLCNFNSNSIADAIKHLSRNPKVADLLGKNARDYILKNHSLNKIYKKELELYQSLYGKVIKN